MSFCRAAGVVVAIAAAWPGAAAAQYPSGPFSPYNGHNPFNCQLQDTGTGVDYPNPDADPLCVEFDKTQQNVTDFGLVEFLSLEPARVAAAVPKCFYYQHDHWTGSIVQGTDPEFWHWDGGYFFDKARGVGGVYVENFRIGGQAMDFGPYASPEFEPYTAPGGGGGSYLIADIEGDPRCVSRVDSPQERVQIYWHRQRVGRVRARSIGLVRIGMHRDRVLRRTGPAHRARRGTLRWEAVGGGELRAGFRGTALDRRVVAVLSTGPRTRLGGRRPGGPADSRRVRMRLGRTKVVALRGGSRQVRAYAGVRGGKVRWVALVNRGRVGSRRAFRRLLRALST